MSPVLKMLDVYPDHRENITKRFIDAKQDMRGFDLSRDIEFEYHGKRLTLKFRIYSFDKELRQLPNCKLLKLPFIVLPSMDDPDFVDQCNATATAVANCLPRGTVLLTEIMQVHKRKDVSKEFMLTDDVINELENYQATSKEEKRRVESLVKGVKEFYTANSYLYARDETELMKFQDIIQNPEYEFGDHKTVSVSVIDVSSLPQEKRNPILLNYVSQVCGQILNFVRKNKTGRSVQLFMIFDEAQNYLPDPSDLYNYVRVIITRGASLGVKAWVITQSPQAIEKEARKQFTTLILSRVTTSSVRDELSKFVQTDEWASKLTATELGKALVVNRETGKDGGKLCITFTTPQTVDVLSTKQIVELTQEKE